MILILKKLQGAFITVRTESGQIKSPEKYLFNFNHQRELQNLKGSRPDEDHLCPSTELKHTVPGYCFLSVHYCFDKSIHAAVRYY